MVPQFAPGFPISNGADDKDESDNLPEVERFTGLGYAWRGSLVHR